MKQSEDDAGGVAGKYFQDNRWEMINDKNGDDFRRRNWRSDKQGADPRAVKG